MARKGCAVAGKEGEKHETFLGKANSARLHDKIHHAPNYSASLFKNTILSHFLKLGKFHGEIIFIITKKSKRIKEQNLWADSIQR
ncbi:hypothetical protein ACHMW4_30250 [Mesorhizobium sp. UC22_110]|uniref:hypothetical protein n=1 Tax=unclassified Mesorhizobium TaxID=325217 RepID=UPI00367092DD